MFSRRFWLSIFGIAGVAAVIGGAIAIAPASSQAATFRTSLSVSVRVINSCHASASPLDFGVYDPAAPADATASAMLRVRCAAGTSYAVRLGQGIIGKTGGKRQMRFDGAHVLSYRLYRDADHRQLWDGAPVYGRSAGKAGNEDILKVYGRIPHGQPAEPGLYRDVVLVSIDY